MTKDNIVTVRAYESQLKSMVWYEYGMTHGG